MGVGAVALGSAYQMVLPPIGASIDQAIRDRSSFMDFSYGSVLGTPIDRTLDVASNGDERDGTVVTSFVSHPIRTAAISY